MSHWNPVDWVEDAEDIAKDLARATTTVATSVADELVDVGNTLVSTGNTLYNDIADGAVATFNTASGGVVYAVDWTETEATEISTYALSATGDIAHFSVDLYGKAKGWAEDAYRFIASALLSTPPPLGPYNTEARDFIKNMLTTYVLSEYLAESIVKSWERDARKKGYTMAIDFDAGVQIVAVTADLIGGVYVDSTGQWGYLASFNASVTIIPALSVAITRDIYMIFGGASAYNDSYYFLGGTVDIEGFIVGVDVLVNPSFKFKGFKATVGFGLEYELFASGGSKSAKSASSKSTDVNAGATLPSLDLYSINLLGEQASTTSVACDVVTDTSQETSITANASAAMTMKSTSVVASDQAGGSGGSSFADDITNVERIKSITIRGGSTVYAISITYVLHDGSTVEKSHGGTGGTAYTLALSDGETIKSVTGRSGSKLDQITFITNYGRTVSAGGTGGSAFTITPQINRPILGVFGRSGSQIDALGVYYRSGKPFTLQAKSSGLYLDLVGQMNAADGASIVQQTSTGGPSQHWLLLPGPDPNQYYIVNAHTGLYLEASGAAGSSIVQNTANGALTQLWGILDISSCCWIVNQSTGLFMDVKGESVEAGAEVIVWTSTQGANQSWLLAPAPTKVYAFSGGGYTGTFQAFGPGKYDMAALTIGNDTIRSIRVPEGWRVTLYQHAGFTGSTQVLTRDAPELASMSGQVSSLVIEMPPWGATIYTDPSYKGTSLTLMPGRYSSLSSLGFSDNALSSVAIPSGWRVTLFADKEFGGAATVLTSSTSDLTTLGVNNTASSVVVESSPLGQVVLYENYRYGGTSQVLAPGRHDVSVLEASGGVGKYKVSSIKVPVNWTVILYEKSGFGGSSKTLTADCARIDDFNDKTSSVVVIPG